MIVLMIGGLVLSNMVLFVNFQSKVYALGLLIGFASMLVASVLECSEKPLIKRVFLLILLALNSGVAAMLMQGWKQFETTSYLHVGFQFAMMALFALVAYGGVFRKERDG